MNYNKGFKHVQKIAKNASPAREILQGIKHNESEIISTDSHRLLSFIDNKASFEDHIIHFKTGETIEGKYPDITNLIKNDDYTTEISITIEDIDLLRKMIKAGKTLKFDNVHLTKFKEYVEFKLITNDNFSNLNQLNMTYTIPYQISDNEVDPIILNLDYMIDLLDFLYDTNSDTTLKIDSNIKPVHFTNDDYTYLILPIRRV